MSLPLGKPPSAPAIPTNFELVKFHAKKKYTLNIIFQDIVLIGIIAGGIFTAWFQFGLKTPRTYSQIQNQRTRRDPQDELCLTVMCRRIELYQVHNLSDDITV